MGDDDDKRIRIVGTSNFELSEVAFELDIALREEELGVIFVEDTVRDAGAIDATVDLDICIIVGLGEVSREAAVVGTGSLHWRKAAGTSYLSNSSLSRRPPWIAAARTALRVRRKRW